MKIFTKKELKVLADEAKKIQPEIVKHDRIKGLQFEDRKVYNLMRRFYKKLCKLDLCFQLNFLLPISKRPELFYRICELDEQGKYAELSDILLGNSYNFLCYSGFIKTLEKGGYIKILPKGEHKTFAEISGLEKTNSETIKQ